MKGEASEPPLTAQLLLVGGSREQAAAFMEANHFGLQEWWWLSAPGPLRLFVLHTQATATAQAALQARSHSNPDPDIE